MKTFALLFLAIAASGCPDIKTDPVDESPKGPTVEFDPANKIIPFPNNLLLDRMTGKVTLPAQCGESPTAKALREGVLNKLDGFGTFEGAMSVTFTTTFDKASLEANLVMYKRVSGGTAVDPASAQKIPVVVRVGTTPRFDASCANPVNVDSATLIPAVPLDQKSTYVVALLDGVKTGTGDKFVPSFTWSLVRSTENPATFDDSGNYVSDHTPLDPNDPAQLEQLKGINLLWNAHAQGMKFLKDKGTDPKTVLLAWEFNTQTTTDALDAAVTGSPASAVAAPLGLAQTHSVLGLETGGPAGETAEQFLIRVLPANSCQSQGGPIPCQAVGDVLGGGLLSKSYQVDTPNPLQGNCSSPSFLGCPVPGPWGDPIKPTAVKTATIAALVLVPAAPCATAGCPTVIFGHGLGQSKTNVFGIGPQLAALGFATVAIDEVGHDSRAVRISNTADADPLKSCADTGPNPADLRPSAVTHPQCYASFLSANLGTTRDNIRQTILDTQTLVAALKTCSGTPCGTFHPDAAHIGYIGQSLGGIQGSTIVATSPDIKDAVLNVPGVGWADIFENTQTLQIRCVLVDGLIDAGILVGAKSNFNVSPPTGLCIGEEWKTQPGYRQFALIGRWVLDPGDPANFTRKLATKKILIQKVDNDTVVPNVATNNEGTLVGLMEQTADCGNPNPAPPPAVLPSSQVQTNPTMNKFLKYVTVPASATCVAGNTFSHGSLLRPANNNNDGRLATGRLQADALFFLSANK